MIYAGISLPAPALATATAGGYEGPDLAWYLAICALIVGAICGLGFLLRRFFSGSLRRRASRRSLQVLDVLPLGGKQRLVVVRCYDRSFLLGVGDREVNPITELDAEETLADKVDETEQIKTVHPVPGADAFEELLRDKATPVSIGAERSAPPSSVLEGGRGVLG
jgi:flagellar biosynthetic protein FliO